MEKRSSFVCPFCQTFAHMHWEQYSSSNSRYRLPLQAAFCPACKRHTIWYGGEFNVEYLVKPVREPLRMMFPLDGSAPPANPDMPKAIKSLYDEAASICERSSKGAAALLRLALEKLCMSLTGSTGKTIDDYLKILAKTASPIPPKLLEAAHAIRVLGNEAVHPGTIDFDDNPDIVNHLFQFINLLIDNQITQPKKIDNFISSQHQDIQSKIKKHQN